MKTLILFLCFFIPAYTFSQGLSAAQKDFYREAQQRFSILDTTRENLMAWIDKDPDILQKLNDNLVQLVEKNRQLIITLPDSLDFNGFYIATAADKNLCLVSWDTRQGGTMIDFTTIALYKTGEGVSTKQLVDAWDGAENTKFHYDIIHTLNDKAGKTIYITHGFGQGSTAAAWQEVRAFRIREDLEAVPVFPGKELTLFLEFDTHEFAEGATVPSITFKNKGKQIRYPLPTKAGGFSGKYRLLNFDGSVFK